MTSLKPFPGSAMNFRVCSETPALRYTPAGDLQSVIPGLTRDPFFNINIDNGSEDAMTICGTQNCTRSKQTPALRSTTAGDQS